MFYKKLHAKPWAVRRPQQQDQSSRKPPRDLVAFEIANAHIPAHPSGLSPEKRHSPMLSSKSLLPCPTPQGNNALPCREKQ